MKKYDQAALEAYVMEKVLPTLGMTGRTFSLEPTGLGNRNRIYFLTVEDAGDYIFKGFTERYRIKNALKAHAFLARHHINTPRVFFSDVTRTTFERFGCFFSCEERIDGKPLAALANTLEVIPGIAEFFARMHSIRSFRWGRLSKRQLFDFVPYTMRKITERLNVLSNPVFCRDTAGVHAARQWFELHKGSMKAVKRFSLCHGDVNPDNILVAADGSIVLIDNEAIKYLPFPIEYFRLQFSLCGEDAAARQLFEDNYFQHAHPDRRRELEGCGDFYGAYVMLEFAWYYNKKLKQLTAANDTAAQHYASCRGKALNGLLRIIDA